MSIKNFFHKHTVTKIFASTEAVRSFTLVETLVAIAILMIAIVGPYYSVQQAITASYVSRDQLIASSLAQEGSEYIYYLRDNNFLNSASWVTGMNSCTGTYGCTIDPGQNAITACTSSGCPALKLSSAGLYTQTGSSPASKYTRTVKITNISAAQIRIVVTVTWITSQKPYSITVTENLYNWL